MRRRSAALLAPICHCHRQRLACRPQRRDRRRTTDRTRCQRCVIRRADWPHGLLLRTELDPHDDHSDRPARQVTPSPSYFLRLSVVKRGPMLETTSASDRSAESGAVGEPEPDVKPAVESDGAAFAPTGRALAELGGALLRLGRALRGDLAGGSRSVARKLRAHGSEALLRLREMDIRAAKERVAEMAMILRGQGRRVRVALVSCH